MKVDFEYNPPTPSKMQLACNAIRAMFFSKQYNGIVPAADLEVVNNAKNWHKIWTKKAVQQAVKLLKKEGYITLDGAKENWIWGFAGMNQTLFENNLIPEIISRKERGIDCTENESVELRCFIKAHIEFTQHCGEEQASEEKVSLMNKIKELFPHELDEVLEDSSL